MINTKEIVGVFGMENNPPIINNGKGSQPPRNILIRKKLIDKINEDNDCVVFGICPTGAITKKKSKTLTDQEKWALMQQLRICDKVVLQTEHGDNEYTRFIKGACKTLNIPIMLADANQNLTEYANNSNSVKIASEFKRLPIVGLIGKNQPDIDPKTGKELKDANGDYVSATHTLLRSEMVSAFNDNGFVSIEILSNDPIDPVKTYVGDEWRDKIPSKEQQEKLIKQIEMCDCVVLTGGIESEAYEVWIAEYCYEHNIPCVGICAGRNNLVRALNCTTTRMLAGKSPEEVDSIIQKHYSADWGVVDAHKATPVKGTPFDEFADGQEFYVNSWHLRALTENDIKGSPFVVSAYDDEGLVEAVYVPNKKLFYGIQFHPELIYHVNAVAKRLMGKINEVANSYMQEREKRMKKEADYDTAIAISYRKLFGARADTLIKTLKKQNHKNKQ